MVTVAGWSMYPALWPGDRYWCRVVPVDQLRRGDIVAVWLRDVPGYGDVGAIKRIVATPGDHVAVRGDRVLVGSPTPDAFRLGPDQYFVVGDNRHRSYDSRQHGPVRADDIECRLEPLGRGMAWLINITTTVRTALGADSAMAMTWNRRPLGAACCGR